MTTQSLRWRLEFLPVPHVRLTAVQYCARDALVGIREIVAKRAIGQAPLIGSEQLREGMGDLCPFTILLIESVVIAIEGMDDGVGILGEMETTVTGGRM